MVNNVQWLAPFTLEQIASIGQDIQSYDYDTPRSSEDVREALQALDFTDSATISDDAIHFAYDVLTAQGVFTEEETYQGADESLEDVDEKRRKLDELRKALLVEEAFEQEAEAFIGLQRALSRGSAYVPGHKGGPLDADSLDTIRAMSEQGTRLTDDYTRDLQGDTGRERVVEFARRFVGESEGRGNTGALVVLANGYEHDPYCAGGMNMVFDRVFGKDVFDQNNYLSARSFEDIGRHFGAIRGPGEAPEAGDIITFPRSGGSGRHVGMITEVRADGTIMYLDFNGGSTVKEVPLQRTHAAIVDVEELAETKLADTEYARRAQEEGRSILDVLSDEQATRYREYREERGLETGRDGSRDADEIRLEGDETVPELPDVPDGREPSQSAITP